MIVAEGAFYVERIISKFGGDVSLPAKFGKQILPNKIFCARVTPGVI